MCARSPELPDLVELRLCGQTRSALSLAMSSGGRALRRSPGWVTRRLLLA